MRTGQSWLGEYPRERVEVDGFVVRRYTLDDAATMVDAVTASIEHLRPWMPWIAYEPQSIEQRRSLLEEWSNEWETKESFAFGIFANDVLVGSTGLHVRSGPGTLEIGYWVHAGHVGRGIATLGARAMVEVGFEIPDVDAIEIVHDPSNIASRRIPEKLEFAFVGEFVRADDSHYAQMPLAPAEQGMGCRWRLNRN